MGQTDIIVRMPSTSALANLSGTHQEGLTQGSYVYTKFEHSSIKTSEHMAKIICFVSDKLGSLSSGKQNKWKRNETNEKLLYFQS